MYNRNNGNYPSLRGEKNMNRSDIMRISALFEIALGSASLIAARFWIGTTNIVGRHVSHGDTTEAFALTYAFTLLQIAIGIIGVMNAEKGRMSTVIFGILAFKKLISCESI